MSDVRLPPPRRTRREYTADAVLVVLALSVWWMFGFATAPQMPAIPEWFWHVDRILGFIACIALWWSRRHPVAVGLIVVIPGAVAVSAGFAALASVYRVGSRATLRGSLGVAALQLGTALPYHAFLPVPGMDWVTWLVVIPMLYLLCLAAGLLVRSRRLVLEGIRAEAAHDRERYEAQLSGARRAERERIAREMHDVLAHRISLVSVHAGALEYRTGRDGGDGAPSSDEIHEAATVIRENAHLAVEELRQVLSILRDDDPDAALAAVAPPQPLLADLPRLFAEAEAAGQRVVAQVDADAESTPSDGVQRAAYRVVQEGLTNARKHAAGSVVTVRVEAREDELLVDVTNSMPVGVTESEIPGAGAGLLGLAERLRIEGGSLRHGLRQGVFRLSAVLPGRQA